MSLATIGHARSSSYVFVPFALLIGGCSTVESRRQGPPLFEQSTNRSLADFEGCFSNAVANQNEVRFMPRANGGTYSALIGFYQNFVPWVVDVDDLGATRRVTVHAGGSIWGPDKKTVRQVQACI